MSNRSSWPNSTCSQQAPNNSSLLSSGFLDSVKKIAAYSLAIVSSSSVSPPVHGRLGTRRYVNSMILSMLSSVQEGSVILNV